MDAKTSAKKAVLEEIMKLMDEHMGEGLKAKSPKHAATEVETEVEMKPEEEEAKADEEMPEAPAAESDEMPNEDRERLKELYERFA